MNFILPKIHNFVDKSKDLENDSPRKFIHVIDGYAVVSNTIVVAVDLREYIKAECDVEADDEFEELTELINWFNGKSFTFEFWNEFVKKSFVVLKTNDCLEIELSSFNKQMIWEDPFVSQPKFKSSLKQIIDNICREGESVERIGINSGYFSVLNSAFSKEMKSDSLIFLFVPSGNGIKFSFYRRDYIFGMFPIDQSSTMSITAFVNDSIFKDKIENTYNEISVEEVEDIGKIESDLFKEETGYVPDSEQSLEDFQENEEPKEIVPEPVKEKKSKKKEKEIPEPKISDDDNPFLLGDGEPDLS